LITASSLVSDDVFLMAGTREGLIIIWEVGTYDNEYKVAKSVHINRGWIFCIETLPGGLVAAGTDHTRVFIVDLKTDTVIQELR
jgi:WD40 repeat protein